MEDKIKDAVKIERYKFILQEISNLNSNTHKFLNLFQTLATAIIGGAVLVFVNWKKLEISADVAIASIRALYWLLVILAIFLIIRVIANVFSWFDYRKEEVELLKEIVDENFRKPPTLKNIWRWDEFYIILFILVVLIAIIGFAEYYYIPVIN